jgi:hypothetical protein
MPRFIIECETEDLILAAKGAAYGALKMPHNDAIVVYGNHVGHEVAFYVKRTKTGFSVRAQRKQEGA